MNEKIFHRGSDEDSFVIEKNNDTAIGIAMRRLSIIDLSTGKQPIFSNDKQKTLLFLNPAPSQYKLSQSNPTPKEVFLTRFRMAFRVDVLS